MKQNPLLFPSFYWSKCFLLSVFKNEPFASARVEKLKHIQKCRVNKNLGKRKYKLFIFSNISDLFWKTRGELLVQNIHSWSSFNDFSIRSPFVIIILVLSSVGKWETVVPITFDDDDCFFLSLNNLPPECRALMLWSYQNPFRQNWTLTIHNLFLPNLGKFLKKLKRYLG